jgi:flagellar hook protein FlgE
MAISSILSTSLTGLQANTLRAHAAANNVVNANTPRFSPSRAHTTSLVSERGIDGGGGVNVQIQATDGDVDLVTEFTQLIAAKTAYKASAQLVRTAQQTGDALLESVSKSGK